jgi:hypothetical protein
VEFLGKIDYLIPTISFERHMETTVLRVLIDGFTRLSNFRIHFDSDRPPESLPDHLRPFADRISLSSWGFGPKRGPASVRNRLASDSDADYLVFVDSDILLSQHFDRNLRLALVEQSSDTLVYPRILGVKQGNIVSNFFQEHVMSPEIMPDGTVMVTSAVLGMKKSTWDSGPRFGEEFRGAGGEDFKFIRDIQASPFSFRVSHREDLVAFHENPSSWSALRARADRYAKQAHLHSPPPPLIGFYLLGLGGGREAAYGFFLVLNVAVARLGDKFPPLAGLFISQREAFKRLVRSVRRHSGEEVEFVDADLLFVENYLYERFFGPMPPGAGHKFSSAMAKRVPFSGRVHPGGSSRLRSSRASTVRLASGRSYSRRERAQMKIVEFFWRFSYRWYWVMSAPRV